MATAFVNNHNFSCSGTAPNYPDHASPLCLSSVADQLNPQNAANVLCNLLGLSEDDCGELVTLISKPSSCLELLLAYLNNLRVMLEDQAEQSSNAKAPRLKNKRGGVAKKSCSNACSSSSSLKAKAARSAGQIPNLASQLDKASSHDQVHDGLGPQHGLSQPPSHQSGACYDQLDMSALLSQLQAGSIGTSSPCVRPGRRTSQKNQLHPQMATAFSSTGMSQTQTTLSNPSTLSLLPPVSMPFQPSSSTPLELTVSSRPMMWAAHQRMPTAHSSYMSHDQPYPRGSDAMELPFRDLAVPSNEMCSFPNMQLAEHLRSVHSSSPLLSPTSEPPFVSFSSLPNMHLPSLGIYSESCHLYPSLAGRHRYQEPAELYGKAAESSGQSCAAEVAGTHHLHFSHLHEDGSALGHFNPDAVHGLWPAVN